MAQLKAFQDKVGNKNATLGQYMNAQRGLTARAGSRNDPSVIQKTLKSGEQAYNPSAPKASDTSRPTTSPVSNTPIPGSAAEPVPSELRRSSAASSPETASFRGRMIPPSESGLGNSPSSPEDVKKQYGTPAELQRDIESKKTPMKEADDPRLTTPSQGAGEGLRMKQGATPSDGSGTDGSTGPDNAATLSKTTPSSRKLSESVVIGDNKYRIV